MMIYWPDNPLLNLLFLVAGIIFLYKSADILIEGASKTAAKIGVSSLVISLTIVAYGTSAPEFVSSVIASLEAHKSIALGNVLGSCAANFLLVLGISAVIRPIKVNKSIIKREMPILLGTVSLFAILSIFSLLNQIGGFILLIAFITYILFFLRISQKEKNTTKKTSEQTSKKISLSKNIVFIILGLIGIVIGAELLIRSSVVIAQMFSISEFFIGVSIVAIGTSLPELAVSALASWKKESDISIGNLIGSNIFNILLIIGVCSLITPFFVDWQAWWSNSGFGIIFLLIISLLLVPILYTGHKISRKEGVFLIALYVFYIWYMFWGGNLF